MGTRRAESGSIEKSRHAKIAFRWLPEYHRTAMRRANHAGTKLSGRKKSYQVRVTLTDENGAKSRKAFYGQTLKEAQQEAQRFLRENESRRPKPTMKLGVFLDQWLEEKKPSTDSDGHIVVIGWQPKTYRFYELNVRAYLKPRLGGLRIDQLTVDQVESLLRDLSAQGLTRTVEGVRATLRAALKTALKKGLIQINPATFAEIPKIRKAPSRPPMTAAMFDQILAAESHPERRIFWQLLVQTGLRPLDEARTLSWTEIFKEDDGYWIYLRSSKTEAGLEPIPISDELYEQLLTIRGDSTYCFPNPATGRPYHERTIGEFWYEALVAAEIDRETTHHRTNLYEIRHLFGRTEAAKLGRHNHVLLKRRLRHAQLSTSQQYYLDVEKADVARLARPKASKKASEAEFHSTENSDLA